MVEQPEELPQCVGKKFKCWSMGDGKEYDFTQEVKRPMKLYATWSDLYKVSYNSNGATAGTIPTDDRYYDTSDEAILADNNGGLERDGYTFGGWSLTSNGTKIDSLTIDTSDVVLYAVWDKKPTYEVTVTNGSGSGSYYEGQKVMITADQRNGYTFSNWSSNDGVSFENESAGTTSFCMGNKEVEVEAKYTKIESSTGDGGSAGVR